MERDRLQHSGIARNRTRVSLSTRLIPWSRTSRQSSLQKRNMRGGERYNLSLSMRLGSIKSRSLTEVCMKLLSSVKTVTCLLSVLAIGLLIPTDLKAQQLVGSIIGTVTDPSGAPIAGAKVQARNLATQVSRSVTTNGTGDFEAASLMPGFYNVTVEA